MGAVLNYYEHHLGDYAKDAGHLSMIEEGAYRRLLDAYYTAGRPLPTDVRECCKLARATSKSERDAVIYILGKFFDLQGDGHHQGRADREIVRFAEKQRKAKASADARWSQSDRNANGMRTHSEGNAPRARPQSPDTKHQSPDNPPSEGSARARATSPTKPDGVSDQVWSDWLALRRAKKAPVTETVVADAEREAGKAGMPLEAFLAEWCSRGSQGLRADWLTTRPAGTGAARPVNRQLAIEAENRRVMAEALGHQEE